jgi:hypothetical protein
MKSNHIVTLAVVGGAITIFFMYQKSVKAKRENEAYVDSQRLVNLTNIKSRS